MNATTITTGKVRLSYCHLNAPVRDPGSDKEKYSASIIVPKTDRATLNAINAAIEEAKKVGVSSKWGGKMPSKLSTPLRDGDVDRPDDPAYANSYFFSAKANADRRPRIFDTALQEILDPSEVYSGCYARVNINFYPYDTNGNRGVSAGLQLVQKVADGTPLGGSVPSAAEAFGAADELLD